MKIIRYIVLSFVTKTLKRDINLDDRVPTIELISLSLKHMIGFVRGILFVRRFIYLAKGVEVKHAKLFVINGGLTRIDEFCKLSCLSENGIILGRNVKIGAYSRLIASGSIAILGKGIEIADNVGIGEFSYIGGAGGVKIGPDCIIGQYFSVHPQNHNFSDPDVVIREQGVTSEGISIGAGCWIGAKVTILDGVKIGNHCVIAAGSVVNKSFPENSVIGGVPAKLIKTTIDESI